MGASRDRGAGSGSADDRRFAAVVTALGKDPGVSFGGKGFGSAALKVNDKIFAMRSSKGLFVVKLPRARVDALVAAGKGQRFDPGRGKLMKEWLVAPPGTAAAWVKLAREALRFVAGDAQAPER